MTELPTSLRRRQLLAGGAGALAGTGLIGLAGEAAAQASAAASAPAAPRPLPAYVAWKDPNAVIVHSATTIETRRNAFGTSGITPAESLYIRNNLPAPDASIVANRDAWQVSIEGVKNPRVLTVAELKTIGVEIDRDGAAVLGQWPRLLPEQAERNAVDRRRGRLRPLERRSGAPCRRGARRRRSRHALSHRHRRREAARQRRSALGHGRALGRAEGDERRHPGVGDEWRAAVACAWRAAAPGRARLQRRQQHQVRQARRLHAGRVAGEDHEHRLPA